MRTGAKEEAVEMNFESLDREGEEWAFKVALSDVEL
jgi:hypothetical protein